MTELLTAWIPDPFARGVVVCLVVVFLIELAWNIAVLLVIRHRRTHLPTHLVRNVWEFYVGDRWRQAVGLRPMWEIRERRAPRRREALAQRSRHAWERFYAEYPSQRPGAAQDPAESPSEPVLSPAFGVPRQSIYRPEEWQEPLRCSVGTECGGRVLYPGEAFYEIPRADGDGALIVCAEDVVLEEELTR
jgi:hypothetical protein